MKVIFLDFDGVINNSSIVDDFIYYPLKNKDGSESNLIFSAENIYAIKKLFHFVIKEDIKIILSTSWRNSFEVNLVDEAFKKFLGCYYEQKIIIGVTPIDKQYKTRGQEVEGYLEGKNISDYIIIDDINSFSPEQNKHLIQTKSHKGLCLEDVDKIENYFLKKRFKSLFHF